MDQIILFALLGLGTGALIAGIGLGIVLTYRGSGVINLATGAISMVAGYLFFTLNTGGFFGIELAVWPAAIVGLLMTLVLGIACEYGVFRQLRNASPLAKLVASLGILLTAQAAIVLIYGTAGRDAPGLLPKNIVEVAGAAIPADRFWLTGIVIVIAALLWALYKYTRFGLATRAASESEANALLAGLSPNRLALAEHDPRDARRRLRGHPRVVAGAAGLHDADAAGGARPGRRAVRPVHVVRDHLLRGPGHRRRAVADLLLLDAEPGSRPTRAQRCRA